MQEAINNNFRKFTLQKNMSTNIKTQAHKDTSMVEPYKSEA